MRVLCAAALLLSAAAHNDAVALLQLAQPQPAASAPGPATNATQELPSSAAQPSPPTATTAEQPRKPNSSAPELVRHNSETAVQVRTEEFAVGDWAYVHLAEGQMAGRVVPCMIKGKKLSGKYHIRVFSPNLSQDFPQVGASFLSKLEPASAAEAVKSFQADTEVKVMMRQLGHEVGLRLRNEWVGRGLNTTEVQRKLKAIRSKMMQDIEVEARAAGCPEGFHLRKGTSRAIDRLESPEARDVIADCKQACTSTEGCHSFQWSPNTKECILVKAAGPKWERPYKDFIYCAEHQNVKGASTP